MYKSLDTQSSFADDSLPADLRAKLLDIKKDIIRCRLHKLNPGKYLYSKPTYSMTESMIIIWEAYTYKLGDLFEMETLLLKYLDSK